MFVMFRLPLCCLFKATLKGSFHNIKWCLQKVGRKCNSVTSSSLCAKKDVSERRREKCYEKGLAQNELFRPSTLGIVDCMQ